PSCWNALRDGNGEASEATMTGPFAEFREWLRHATPASRASTAVAATVAIALFVWLIVPPSDEDVVGHVDAVQAGGPVTSSPTGAGLGSAPGGAAGAPASGGAALQPGASTPAPGSSPAG